MATIIEDDKFLRLERELHELKEHCKQLRDGQTFLVPIEDLSPEPFQVKKMFHAVVRPSEGEFILEKDKGHDHIPAAIHLSPNDSKRFAQCDLTYQFWVDKMREKGFIPDA